MKTGLSKKQKTTSIYFDEASSIIEVCTCNTALKNRLTDYAAKCQSERIIDDDENGCLAFEIKKERFGFKLTTPYSEARRRAASDYAKRTQKSLVQKESNDASPPVKKIRRAANLRCQRNIQVLISFGIAIIRDLEYTIIACAWRCFYGIYVCQRSC